MRTVFKYNARHPAEIPDGARVLKVAVQHSEIWAWCLVDTDAPRRKRLFHIVGTGHAFNPDGYTYLDTVFDGPFVWHVFTDAGWS